MRKIAIMIVMTILSAATVLPAYSSEALQPPVVTLERVEVASIQPFYMTPRIDFKDCENPGTVGKYGYGSIMNLAYIFNIQNPNKEPVMLDEIRFTTAFDGFDVNAPSAYEDQWIPAGMTNQVRVMATNEPFPTMVSLMLDGSAVKKLKEMGMSQAEILKKWWNTVGDFSFPIEVKNGVATFECEKGDSVLSYFTATFP